MKPLECPSEGYQSVGLASGQPEREGGCVGLEIGGPRRTVPASGRQAKLSDLTRGPTCLASRYRPSAPGQRTATRTLPTLEAGISGIQSPARIHAGRGVRGVRVPGFHAGSQPVGGGRGWFEAGVGSAGPVKLQSRLSISPRPTTTPAEVRYFVHWTERRGGNRGHTAGTFARMARS